MKLFLNPADLSQNWVALKSTDRRITTEFTHFRISGLKNWARVGRVALSLSLSLSRYVFVARRKVDF